MTLEEFNKNETEEIEKLIERALPHEKIPERIMNSDRYWAWQSSWVVSAHRDKNEITHIFVEEQGMCGDFAQYADFRTKPFINPFIDWTKKDNKELANRAIKIIKEKRKRCYDK